MATRFAECWTAESRCYDSSDAVITPDDRATAFLATVTYLRVLLTPVVMALVLHPRGRFGIQAATVCFCVAAITDFVDGRLARRWKKATTLGNFLDTTADKLLVSGVLLSLVAVGRASAWLAFIMIGREILILGLRGAVSAAGAVVLPSIWGKLKANIQFVAIALAIWRPNVSIGHLRVDQVAMLVATAITIGSAVEYLARFRGALAGSESSG
jgi:CDP-diacylglycerol---glycerol-3-phosphate 3-phosphatidyltransferase